MSEKLARNRAVVAMHDAGVQLKDIAALFGISNTRAQQIFHRHKERFRQLEEQEEQRRRQTARGALWLQVWTPEAQWRELEGERGR